MIVTHSTNIDTNKFPMILLTASKNLINRLGFEALNIQFEFFLNVAVVNLRSVL